ncbi:hypothetical protein PMAYCL1PPCAC_03620, partial [Pristionchus mayeri]
RTFHLSSGRDLEGSRCCCSFKRCALFHSVLFSLLSAFSPLLSLLAPMTVGAAASISLATLLSIALLCSVVAPIGIHRRSSLFLAPFISLLVILLTLGITLIIATVIYSIMQEELLFRFLFCFYWGVRKVRIIFCFFYFTAISHPSSFHRTLILSFSLIIFFSLLFLVIQALFVNLILWRRFYSNVHEKDVDSIAWMFAHLNGSHSRKITSQIEIREWRTTTYVS